MEEEIKSQSPYQQRLAQIYSNSTSPPGYRKDIGMQDIYEFDTLFGRKHQKFKTIHVTGTNGKGSACIKISSALALAGYKVGRFTSPHISSCRQRISINSKLISEEDFVLCADSVLSLLNQNQQIKLKFSEKLFFVGLAYFAMKEVDVAVIEVSIGGKHDSTIIINPVLSVITSVSLDHLDILGPTVEHIATQKSGIIKAKVPCILGPSAQPKSIFIEVAKSQESLVYNVEIPPSENLISFAQINKRIARQALQILQQQFTELNEAAISQGIERNQPCRMEYVPQKQLSEFLSQTASIEVILDVAHNPGAITALVDYFVQQEDKQVWGVCCFSKKKSHTDILQYLLSKLKVLYFVSNTHFKLMKAESLLSLASQINQGSKASLGVINNGDISLTLKEVLKKASEVGNVRVLVFGSFFMMEEVRECLGYEDIRDETHINQKANQLLK